MNDGWIKLHRQFRKWEWYTDTHMVQLFIHCLLSANHQDGKWKGNDIKRGQFITSLPHLRRDTGISIQSLRTCLARLVTTQEITCESTNQFRLITVNNYENYQSKETPTDEPTDGQQATNRQLTSNKNEKKLRTYVVRPETESLAGYIDELCQQYDIMNKVNTKALDIEVARHLSTGIHLRVEVRKCISWLIDKGKKDVTTQRLTNWFEKAKEIQKRDQGKELERKKKLNDDEQFKIHPSIRSKLIS